MRLKPQGLMGKRKKVPQGHPFKSTASDSGQINRPHPAVQRNTFLTCPLRRHDRLLREAGHFLVMMTGHNSEYLRLNSTHFSMSGSVSGRIASAGHSGSHTPTVDAFIRVNHQHVFTLIEAVHRTNFDAVGVFASNAAVVDNVGHKRCLNEVADLLIQEPRSFKLSAFDLRAKFAICFA